MLKLLIPSNMEVSMLPGPTITKEEFEQHEDDYKQHDVVRFLLLSWCAMQ